MQHKRRFAYVALIAVFLLGACAPNASKSAVMEPSKETMVDQPTEVMLTEAAEMMADPTETMLDEQASDMMAKPTEAMMGEPTEAMMDEATEAMMEGTADPMMQETAVPDMNTPAAPAGTGMMDEPAEDVMMEVPQWLGTALIDVASGETFTLGDYNGKVVLVELMAQWCPTCLRQQQQVAALYEKLGMDSDLVIVALDIDANETAETLKTYAASHGFEWTYAVAPPEMAREIGNLYGPQYLNPPSAPMLLIDRHGQVTPLPFGVKDADELGDLIQPLLDAGM